MNTELHFSSATAEWSTPKDFYDKLNNVFGFLLDPCATKENTKAPVYCTKEDDGLSKDWSGYKRVFMNPPYGRELKLWMKKAYEESLKGALVVCLVPARPDTKWWWEYATKGEIKFVKGRLKFGGCKDSAPFPSAVVIFYPQGTFQP